MMQIEPVSIVKDQSTILQHQSEIKLIQGDTVGNFDISGESLLPESALNLNSKAAPDYGIPSGKRKNSRTI